MKMTLCLFLLGFCLLSLANAQSISRSVISSSGSDNESLSYTIGETVIETGNGGNLILTQGFQQPDQISGTFLDPQLGALHFLLYPNPTQAALILELEGEQRQLLKVSFTDVRGRIVMSAPDLVVDQQSQSTYDVSHFAAGTYILMLKNQQGQIMQSVRFVKTD